MLSEAAPNSNLDAAGLDSEIPASKTISLTPEQMDALSLSDVAPGQIINIQLEFGGVDQSPTADGDQGPEAAGGSSADPNGPKMFTVVSSTTETPDEAPPGADEAELPGDETESPESKVLGFNRPKKTPRIGLPDTKKMRNL